MCSLFEASKLDAINSASMSIFALPFLHLDLSSRIGTFLLSYPKKALVIGRGISKGKSGEAGLSVYLVQAVPNGAVGQSEGRCLKHSMNGS